MQRSVVMATAQQLTFISTFCQSHPRSRCSVLLRVATRCNLSARNELMLLIIALNQSHSQRGHINNYSNTCAYTHIYLSTGTGSLFLLPSLPLSRSLRCANSKLVQRPLHFLLTLAMKLRMTSLASQVSARRGANRVGRMRKAVTEIETREKPMA